MDWEAIEAILESMHCNACDGYQCDHREKVSIALENIKSLYYKDSGNTEDE